MRLAELSSGEEGERFECFDELIVDDDDAVVVTVDAIVIVVALLAELDIEAVAVKAENEFIRLMYSI